MRTGGLRHTLCLEPWYIFIHSFHFFITYSFLILIFGNFQLRPPHQPPQPWTAVMMIPNDDSRTEETTRRTRAQDAHCILSPGMFFYLLIFYTHFFPFYTHFWAWPPHQLQPPPWTALMTTPNDGSRAEGDNDKDKGSRCTCAWALVCFFSILVFFYSIFFLFFIISGHNFYVNHHHHCEWRQ